VHLEKAMTRTSTSPVEAVDGDLLEPSYMESVRRFHERQRDENRQRWIHFHSDMARLHLGLAARHEEKVQALSSGEATLISTKGQRSRAQGQNSFVPSDVRPYDPTHNEGGSQ
jgi:hypothetical protein